MGAAFVTSLMPPFNLALLHQKLDDDLAKLQATSMPTTTTTTTLPSPSAEVYKIQEKFETKDRYWVATVGGEQYANALKNGVLFRPAVINELVRMVEKCLAEDLPRGFTIKGSQGIGKSHSIVNLVRQLLYHSNGKYFVTFIPDCAVWIGAHNLFKFICASFGSTPDELGITWTNAMLSKKYFLEEFVEAIDAKLAEQGRQWVFIIDQIDMLSARYQNVRDISALPFPFNYMRQIMKRGRITSILSASANNALLHCGNNHSDFLDYDHCLSFRKEEIIGTWPSLTSFDDEVIESIMAKTGGVPLQVQILLSQPNEGGPNTLDFKTYEGAAQNSVKFALDDIDWLDQWRDEKLFLEVTQNACRCLLSLPLEAEPHIYDRRYSVWENGYLVPLFPHVSDAYRAYFWKELLEYVEEK